MLRAASVTAADDALGRAARQQLRRSPPRRPIAPTAWPCVVGDRGGDAGLPEHRLVALAREAVLADESTSSASSAFAAQGPVGRA